MSQFLQFPISSCQVSNFPFPEILIFIFPDFPYPNFQLLLIPHYTTIYATISHFLVSMFPVFPFLEF